MTNLPHASLKDRLAQGKALRKRVPRSAHAAWAPASDRPDPVAMLEASSRGRLPELVPIRHGRMLASPFTFLRGSAAVMAYDLSVTPTTGITAQLGGDCHLLNFGGFGTPERRFIFDVTDFDETLPGPWEWDVKRLAASVVSAGRGIGMPGRRAKEAAQAAVRSYRANMRALAGLHVLDRWYARIDGQALLDLMMRRSGQPLTASSDPHTAEHLVARITEVAPDGRRRFRDNPPLVFHPPQGDRFHNEVRLFLERYRATLQDDRRTLLDQYHVVDLAMKVVGVGSVGTRCAILLLMAGDDDLLVLQYKEAVASVLEPYVGKSRYKHHAQRVVCGQRLLQSASDLFLGWASDEHGRDFYFRQLRDMKTSVTLDGLSPSAFTRYAELCGAALARGHGKSSDPALIAGYLGDGAAFDTAVAEFASTYADQTERDHASLAQAVKAGRIVVHPPR
jgi:uncharacterized protein (DUF2252 family)